MMIRGKILRDNRGIYFTETDNGIIQCRCSSKIRKDGIMALAGDYAGIELNNDNTGFIHSIEKRKNKLVRPAVANIDLLAIVIAAAEPSPLYYNIDKLTAAASYADIEVCMLANKTDIASADEIISVYSRCGFKCFELCAKTGSGVNDVRRYFAGKTVVLAGASGVGKSSLLNAVFPSLNTEIGELSQRILRGKNTTRHTELYAVGDNTYIADTPGFSKLFIEKDYGYATKEHNDASTFCLEIAKEQLVYAFPEMLEYVTQCRFRGCTHLKENGCAVIEAVNKGLIPLTRHESYVKIYQEIK